MSADTKQGLGFLVGAPPLPEELKVNPRKAALRRLRRALKDEDDDSFEEALEDYLEMRDVDKDKSTAS